MYIFSIYFAKWNLWSHFLHPFSINFWRLWMWGWKVSIWRTECSNYLPKSHHDCNLPWIWLYVLLQKCPRVEFFIGYLLQMLRANDFDRDGCRKFIGQFHCRKMKTFSFAGVIAERATSSETLRWRILYLFPCPSNP